MKKIFLVLFFLAALVVFNRKTSAYEGYKYVNLINGSDIQRGEENYFIDRWINVKANNTYTLVIPCNYYDDKANDCYESLDGLIINCSARNENTMFVPTDWHMELCYMGGFYISTIDATSDCEVYIEDLNISNNVEVDVNKFILFEGTFNDFKGYKNQINDSGADKK